MNERRNLALCADNRSSRLHFYVFSRGDDGLASGFGADWRDINNTRNPKVTS